MDIAITVEMRERALKDALLASVEENLQLRQEKLALQEAYLALLARLDEEAGDAEQVEVADYLDIDLEVESPEADGSEVSIP